MTGGKYCFSGMACNNGHAPCICHALMLCLQVLPYLMKVLLLLAPQGKKSQVDPLRSKKQSNAVNSHVPNAT